MRGVEGDAHHFDVAGGAVCGADAGDQLAHPVLDQIHFSSERKRMTTVVNANGRLLALVKGDKRHFLVTRNYLALIGYFYRHRSDAKARNVLACFLLALVAYLVHPIALLMAIVFAILSSPTA